MSENMNNNNNNILEVKNLYATVMLPDKKFNILNGVSFELQKGHVLGIVGESGSGKSVTALSILKLLSKDIKTEGEIIFEGENIINYNYKEMQNIRGKKISMIFQDAMTALNPVWTIGYQLLESIKLHTELDKNEANKYACELLTKVGISDAENRMHAYPHELSGGMRQRVMIAMAIASKPEILIADEPTTALDVTVQAEILDLIKQLTKENNMSTILITHDLGIIVDLADDLCIFYAGTVYEKGTTKDIFTNAKNEYTKALLSSVPSLKNEGRMKPIPGTPVNLQKLPTGCAFYPRCKCSMKICKEKEPIAMDFGNGHISYCFENVEDALLNKTNKM